MSENYKLEIEHLVASFIILPEYHECLGSFTLEQVLRLAIICTKRHLAIRINDNSRMNIKYWKRMMDELQKRYPTHF